MPRLPSPSTLDADPRSTAALLRLVADAVPVMLAYYEATDMRCVFANRRYAEHYGQTVHSIIGLTVRSAVGEPAWQVIQPYVQRVLRGEAVQYARPHTGLDGRQCMLEVSLQPQFAAGRVEGIVVLVSDITRHWEAERALLQGEARMRKFAEATEEAIAFHRDGIIFDCNDATQRMTGYTCAELVGRPILSIVAPECRPLVLEYLSDRREVPYELVVLRKDGRPVQVEAVAKTMPHPDGDYRVVVGRDITARKHAQEQAAFLALHDTLTQLPNRLYLMRVLPQLLAAAQHRRTRAAMLFIDMDHFKTVNESLGHEAGDQLLSEVARRLQDGVAQEGLEGSFVARVGGDQFVMVLADIGSRAAAATLADGLVQRVRAGYAIGGTPLSLSPSIGISVFPEDGYDADELLRRAHAAMQQAKESGRGTRQFYAPGMEAQSAEILQMEHQLREAVFQEAFVLHYQPQVEVASGRLVGFEALVRWRHPQRGLVGPNEFIPLAESRGLIAPIGRWVLREACRQLKAWHDEGLPRVPVAVNLSALELRQRDVTGDIAAALGETGLAPQYLEIEITESALMWDANQTSETLAALRRLGVAVTVDDFGTGYSSLAYLKRYPLDKLKIDRSFVAETPADGDDVAIVTAIVQLAHSLQLQAVAEGVETQQQMELLRHLGCELAQGYGISRPMDAQQARTWMKVLAG